MRPLYPILFCILSACGTAPLQYKPQDAWNPTGYSEQKKTDEAYHVSFVVRGIDSPEVAEKMLVRRAAEITVRDGYDWFLFFSKTYRDRVIGYAQYPEYYGIIHLKKGIHSEEGYDARGILTQAP